MHRLARVCDQVTQVGPACLSPANLYETSNPQEECQFTDTASPSQRPKLLSNALGNPESYSSGTSGGTCHTAAATTSARRLHSLNRPDDVVICCALRTPLTKANKGGLSPCMPEELLLPLFEKLISTTNVDPSKLQDVCIGNVLMPGAGVMSSRIAQILAGIPSTCPIHTVNRLCSSGLQSVATVAAHIHAGHIELGIGGGVESMTHFDMMSTMNPEKMSELVFDHEEARNCLLPMGMTSENVVDKFGITRQDQDKLAVLSHQKAAHAQKHGLFDEEIVPVTVQNTATGASTVIRKDDGIRPDTTIEGLAKLRPSFKKTGTTTAGNSSQITDGAALVLMARRSTAERLRLPILARFVSFAVVGVPPSIMGIGPAVAIPMVLKKTALRMEDIDIFEVNEAFASQAAYCVNHLGIPMAKLNPKGGAIALGHPLGCTGSRQIATLLPELRRQGKRYGIVSMCVGTGMGAAAVIENLVFK